MTRLNIKGLLALFLTVLTLGLGQVPASAQMLGRVPYLSPNPCKGVTLSLAFAKSTGANCLNGSRYASVTNMPGFTYTGGASTGSYAAKLDGSLQLFAQNVPRITDAGYLAEEARTNSIRNNSMVGVATGTPGTAPTNWTITNNGNGLSSQIVATGTDSVTGASYIEVRFFGTTGTASASQIKFETSIGIAAVNAQAWTLTAYGALVAGSVSGFSAGPVLQFDMNNSGGSYVGNSSNTALTTSATMTRATLTFTTNQATTAFVTPYIAITPGSGKTVDFTLRVSLPQMELGSFATSPIPTTSVAVTRAADLGYISGLVVPSTGTLVATANAPTTTADQFWAFASDGSLNNRISVGNVATTGLAAGVVYAAGVGAQIGSAAATASVKSVAMSYAAGAQSLSAAGASPTAGTVATVPTVTRLDIGGGGAATAIRQVNGLIRRIVIYPRAMSNSELQAITIGPVSFANDNAPEAMQAALWGWVA